MMILRGILFGIIVVAVAVISAGILPWFPFFRSFPLITFVLILTIAWSSRPSTIVLFLISTSLAIDLIIGSSIGQRSVVLLAASVICWPSVQSYLRQRHLASLIVIAIVLSLAEMLAIPYMGGGLSAPHRWTLFIGDFWPTIGWGVVSAVVAHTFLARLRPILGHLQNSLS